MNVLLAFLFAVFSFVEPIATGTTLIPLIVSFAKKLGFPDGYAGFLQAGLNFVLFAIYFFAKQAGSVEQVDTILEHLTVIAPSLFALLTTIVFSKLAYQLYKYVGLAYSYNGKPSA